MPVRMVDAVRRREREAREAWNDVDPDAGQSSQRQRQRAPPEAQTFGPEADKCVISWTGGKDCNLSLLIAWRDPMLHVVALVVFRPEDAEFKAHPLHLMEAQAGSLGLPLLHVVIPRDTTNYKEAYVRGMRQLRETHNVTVIATGDMDLVGSMTRNWIEECGEEAGLRAFLPLWQSDREANLRRLIDERRVGDCNTLANCLLYQLKRQPGSTRNDRSSQHVRRHTHCTNLKGCDEWTATVDS